MAQSFILDENQATAPSYWPNGSSQTSVAYGGDYIHDNKSHDGSFVEWDLVGLVDSGKCYEVSAIWNANGSGTRATSVRYEIDHDGGTAVSLQNQNNNTNSFNVLSTSGGESSFQNPTAVRVFTGTTSSEEYVIADALEVSEAQCPSTPPTAGGEGVYIPLWWQGADGSLGGNTRIYLSNISDQTITVSIDLYKQDGSLLTDDGSKTGGNINGRGNETSYDDSTGISFQLSAGASSSILLKNVSSETFGYGTVEWSSSTAPVDGVALVGQTVTAITGTSLGRASSVPLNEGKPF